jgi:nucleotide-binding universal stress UspA family protein
MYDRVIVPLDGSPMAERAVAPAVEVAQRAGAELVATMVVDDTLTEDHRAYVKHLLSPFDVASPPPYIIHADDVAECIANAGEADRSLVVMTSHGSSGIRRAVLGSVAEGVVRELQKPVLLIGPRCEAGRSIAGGRVLVPLDGSRRAEAILDPVAAWCDLMALQAWPVTALDPTGIPAPEVPDDAYLRRVTRQLSDRGISSSWDVVHHRDAAEGLVSFALGLPASLIAMTTHGRTGLARVTLGSVATRLVHEVTAPVLILRPELDEATLS